VEVDDNNQDEIKNAIERITVGDYPDESEWINWGTPLAETMCVVLDYYKGDYNDPDNIFLGGSTSLSSPLQHECQQNFVIVVTDGFTYADDFNGRLPDWLPPDGLDVEEDGMKHDPQGWLNDGHGNWGWRNYSGNGTDYMDDIAQYMAQNDFCDSSEGDQVIYTYTIGFLVDFPLLIDTADVDHGNGEYMLTTSAEELAVALEDAITDIINRTSSGTAAAVLSTSLKTGNMLYSAKFTPLNWSGELQAFALPFADGSRPVWSAGELLEARDAATRSIYTAKIDTWYQTVNVRETFDTSLDNSLSDDDRDVINWVRGEHVEDFRDRGAPGGSEWKLGDIIYSSPIVVGPPRGPHLESSYSDFKQQWKDRPPVIYVGANDGMLHCFDAYTGQERWAFIPHCFAYETYYSDGYYEDEVNLEDLEDLTSPNYIENHRYFVDGNCVSADVYIDPDFNGISEWRTILICGLRGGGSGYICMDITNPDDPKPIWSYRYYGMGESWCLPSVGRINFSGYDTWVMVIGTGPDPGDDPYYDGKMKFYVVEIGSGYPLLSKKVCNLSNNMTMGIANIDYNQDGYLDFLYTGDRKGRIWKYDTTCDSIFKDKLFLARSASDDIQPIMVMPTLFLDKYNRVMVQFGTGKFFEPQDRLDMTPQSFYGIIDDNSGTPDGPWKRADMADQSDSTNFQEIEGTRGFFIDLPVTGERVITESVFFDGITFFTSFVPTQDVCDIGGAAYLYFIEYYSGKAFERPVVDINKDNQVNQDDYVEGTRSVLLGSDSGAPSKPIISPATNEVVIQTSDTRIRTRLFDFDVIELISWRQDLSK